MLGLLKSKNLSVQSTSEKRLGETALLEHSGPMTRSGKRREDIPGISMELSQFIGLESPLDLAFICSVSLSVAAAAIGTEIVFFYFCEICRETS